jgi:hypothetical protein
MEGFSRTGNDVNWTNEDYSKLNPLATAAVPNATVNMLAHKMIIYLLFVIGILD